MNRRSYRQGRPLVAASLALVVAGCAGEVAEQDAAGALQVERSTEGNVTTVRNLSGSTWGGEARLVEEVSIGVLEGAEEYMFGRVFSLWVTDDELFVVDSQAPAVRVYDYAGSYLRTIGREGQGPGEYDRPGAVVVLPDGGIALQDSGNRRVVFFDPEEKPESTWIPEKGFLFGLDVLGDGTLVVNLALPPDEPTGMVFETESGVASLTPSGELGDMRFPPKFGFESKPIIIESASGGGVMAVTGASLFRPSHVWGVRPDGALVAGVSDKYEFSIVSADESTIAVERVVQPFPLAADEADYAVKQLEAQARRMVPDWSYDGDPLPAVRPYFDNIVADRDNRVWVVRNGAGVRQTDCVENPHDDVAASRQNPCWKSPRFLDVFAADGSYLGELHRPDDLTFTAVFIRGDNYWAAVEDEDGLVTVRRFRIVTPQDS